MSFVKWMNGTSGRLVRVLAGVALILAGLALGSWYGVTLAVLGLVPLVAGSLGACVLAPVLRVPARER